MIEFLEACTDRTISPNTELPGTTAYHHQAHRDDMPPPLKAPNAHTKIISLYLTSPVSQFPLPKPHTMANITPGFAIRRNGSCLATESDCGETLAPFRGCCPGKLACPHQYNVACCPQGQNCTAELVAAPQPRCANGTWDLFDNNGMFCCERGESAYDRQNTDVCARAGAQLQEGDRVLKAVSVGAGMWVERCGRDVVLTEIQIQQRFRPVWQLSVELLST